MDNNYKEKLQDKIQIVSAMSTDEISRLQAKYRYDRHLESEVPTIYELAVFLIELEEKW